MHRPILIFTAFLLGIVLSSPLTAQEETEEPAKITPAERARRFSLSLGAAAGNYAIDAPGFNDVYSNRSVSRAYFTAIGTNAISLIAKYRQFFAYGASSTSGIDVRGKADWRQKHYAVGFRFRTEDQFLYADLLYVISRVREDITTGEEVVDRLTVSQENESKGYGASVGLSVKLIGPIGVYIEGEYSAMVKRGRNAAGEAIPQIGGMCGMAGIHFTL